MRYICAIHIIVIIVCAMAETCDVEFPAIISVSTNQRLMTYLPVTAFGKILGNGLVLKDYKKGSMMWCF